MKQRWTGAASHCGMKILKRFEWSEWAQLGPPRQAKLNWNWIEWKEIQWNLIGVACRGKKGVGLLVSFFGGLWPLAAARGSAKRREQPNKPTFISLFSSSTCLIERKDEEMWLKKRKGMNKLMKSKGKCEMNSINWMNGALPLPLIESIYEWSGREASHRWSRPAEWPLRKKLWNEMEQLMEQLAALLLSLFINEIKFIHSINTSKSWLNWIEFISSSF